MSKRQNRSDRRNNNIGKTLFRLSAVRSFQLLAVHFQFNFQVLNLCYQIIKIDRFKHVVKFLFQTVTPVIQGKFFTILATVVTLVIFSAFVINSPFNFDRLGGLFLSGVLGGIFPLTSRLILHTFPKSGAKYRDCWL